MTAVLAAAAVTFGLLFVLLFTKTALVLVWYLPLEPILHPLGVVVVQQDLSYGIYAVRWQRDDMAVSL